MVVSKNNIMNTPRRGEEMILFFIFCLNIIFFVLDELSVLETFLLEGGLILIS